jgi:hypothetical protein
MRVTSSRSSVAAAAARAAPPGHRQSLLRHPPSGVGQPQHHLGRLTADRPRAPERQRRPPGRARPAEEHGRRRRVPLGAGPPPPPGPRLPLRVRRAPPARPAVGVVTPPDSLWLPSATARIGAAVDVRTRIPSWAAPHTSAERGARSGASSGSTVREIGSHAGLGKTAYGLHRDHVLGYGHCRTNHSSTTPRTARSSSLCTRAPAWPGRRDRGRARPVRRRTPGPSSRTTAPPLPTGCGTDGTRAPGTRLGAVSESVNHTAAPTTACTRGAAGRRRPRRATACRCSCGVAPPGPRRLHPGGRHRGDREEVDVGRAFGQRDVGGARGAGQLLHAANAARRRPAGDRFVQVAQRLEPHPRGAYPLLPAAHTPALPRPAGARRLRHLPEHHLGHVPPRRQRPPYPRVRAPLARPACCQAGRPAAGAAAAGETGHGARGARHGRAAVGRATGRGRRGERRASYSATPARPTSASHQSPRSGRGCAVGSAARLIALERAGRDERVAGAAQVLNADVGRPGEPVGLGRGGEGASTRSRAQTARRRRSHGQHPGRRRNGRVDGATVGKNTAANSTRVGVRSAQSTLSSTSSMGRARGQPRESRGERQGEHARQWRRGLGPSVRHVLPSRPHAEHVLHRRRAYPTLRPPEPRGITTAASISAVRS